MVTVSNSSTRWVDLLLDPTFTWADLSKHTVVPHGKLRFALTSRYIIPATIPDPVARKSAETGGQLAKSSSEYKYDSSITTGTKMQALPQTEERHDDRDAWPTTVTVSSEELQQTYFSMLDSMKTPSSSTQASLMQTTQFSTQDTTMRANSYFSQAESRDIGFEQHQYSAQISAAPTSSNEQHRYLMNPPASHYPYAATTYPSPSMYPTYNSPYGPMMAAPANTLQSQSQQPQYHDNSNVPITMTLVQSYDSSLEDGHDKRERTLANHFGQ
jgi:hypothetical protein